MNEIIKTRNLLSKFIKDNHRSPYEFKRHCIEHSLYGVDIDPGAVEIAKLRLWLSLVVDEENIRNIKPLPNLDYRIMQGNSLISEFMGINFDESKEKNNKLFKNEFDEIITQFQIKKYEFINESNITRKIILKKEIEDLLIKIFELKLKIQKSDYFKKLKNIEDTYSRLPNEKERDIHIFREKEKVYKVFGFNLETTEKQLLEFTSGKNIKPFFLWKLYFSEVFHKKGGFDVVIGNPPYVVLPKHNFNENYKFIKGNNNTYVGFLECSIKYICNGTVSFIIPTTWLAGNNFKELRKYLLSNKLMQQIIQLPYDIFENAYVDNLIIILTVNKNKKDYVQTFKFQMNEKLKKNINFSIFNIQEWIDEPEHVIFLNKNLKSLLKKYRKIKSIPLANIADVQRGTLPPKQDNFIYDTPNDLKLIPWFDGQVYRYFIKKGIFKS